MTSIESHLSHPKYRPDIDGLRAIAVLSVVSYHAFPNWVKGGFIGVDVFFVISGYLISTIIFENLDKGTFSFSEFYSRRIRRIFPALLLVLTVSYVLGWFTLLAAEYKQLGKHIAGGAGFISNFILWKESGYFDNAAETKPLLHLWSLGVEEQFYLVYPLLLWLAWKKRFNLLKASVLIAVISFYLNIKGIKKDTVATFFTPQTRFWELMCGSMLSWMTLYKQDVYLKFKYNIARWPAITKSHKPRELDGKTIVNLASFFGLSLLLYGFWRIQKGMNFPGVWALVPVLGAILIISAGQKAWINRIVFSNRIAVWFGLISFPLYLWHWPLLSFARIVENEVPGRDIRMTAVILSVMLSWVTYKLVERPMRLGQHGKTKVSALFALMIIVGCIGYSAYDRDGFPLRPGFRKFEAQTMDLNFSLKRSQGWLCDDPRFQESHCYYEGKIPTTVVIGDSHAPRIYSGLIGFYKAKNISLANFGGSGGCPPLLNVVSKNTPGDDLLKCIQKTSDALEYIIKDKNINHVILTGRGPLYITKNGFGDSEDERFGSWVLNFKDEPEGIRSNSEVYEMALENTVKRLINSGKSVTFLHDVPELGFDIHSCVESRPFSISYKVRTPCAVNKEDFLNRTKEFRALVYRVISKFPAVKSIDLAEALCDEKWCYGGRDGVLYYTDDDHLSRRGSEFVVHQLSDKFNQLLVN